MGYGVAHVFGDNVNAIGTDSDPNTAEPPDTRIFNLRGRAADSADFGIFLYVLPKGGTTISLRPWVFDRTLNRWFSATAAGVACANDALTPIIATSPALPSGAKCFLQVTANTGIKQVGVGQYEDG